MTIKKIRNILFITLLSMLGQNVFSMNINIAHMETVKEEYWLGDFENGFAQISKNGFFGLIDSTGAIVIEPKYDDINIITQIGCIVTLNGKMGISNFSNELLCDLRYEQIQYVDSYGWFIVRLGEKYGIVSGTGKLIESISYDEIRINDEHNMFLTKENKMYFINIERKKEELLQQNMKSRISSDRFIIEEYGKYGIADFTGTIIAEVRYDFIDDFIDGKAIFTLDRKKGLVDVNGNVLLDPKFDKIELYKDCYKVGIQDGFTNCPNVSVSEKKKFQWGILFKDLTTMFQCKYDEIVPIGNDCFIVSEINCNEKKCIVINQKGEPLTTESFDLLQPTIENGFILASKNNKYGFLDSKFVLKDGFKYDFIGEFSDQNKTAIYELNNKSGLINSKGQTYSKAKYQVIRKEGLLYIGAKENGLNDIICIQDNRLKKVQSNCNVIIVLNKDFIYYKKRGKHGLVSNCKEKIRIDKISTIKFLCQDFFVVSKNNGFKGIINEQGDQVLPNQYNQITYNPQEKGIFRIQKKYDEHPFLNVNNNYQGIADYTGRILINCAYDSISKFTNGIAWVKTLGKWGVINKSGASIAPCVYTAYKPISDDLFAVRKDELWGVINKSGDVVESFIHKNYSDIIRRD